jgi:hypothetical protein
VEETASEAEEEEEAVVDVEMVVLLDKDAVLPETPMVVMTEGVPGIHQTRVQSMAYQCNQRTCEGQHVPLLLTAGFRTRKPVNTNVQILGRVCTFHNPIPALQEVDPLLNAVEGTAGALPRLIRT